MKPKISTPAIVALIAALLGVVIIIIALCVNHANGALILGLLEVIIIVAAVTYLANL